MTGYKKITTISIIIVVLITILPLSSHIAWAATTTYYISPQGNDSNSGSLNSPWHTLAHAVDKVPDNSSTIVVKDGVYEQCISITRRFQTHLLITAEHPYKVRWQCNQALPVIKFAAAKNITLEGFEITRPDLSKTYDWLVIAWNSSSAWAENITFHNNIFHDSVQNDLLRVGPGANHIRVENNMFYNQAGKDEHIDINGAYDVIVQDNIFFNDFEGSGRPNLQGTSSYIVIKDSTAAFGGSQQIRVRQNVFLSWQGKRDKQFVLVGEDGISTFEAVDVTIENNLMLGNGTDAMGSPLGVRGSKNVTVRANTIVGNLPSWYFGIASYIVKNNLPNENINIYNNIWSDPTGTMGSAFSCCNPSQTLSYTFDNNLYFNKGNPFPTSSDSFVEVTDDAHRIIGDPQLGDQSKGITVPRWNGTNFNGNYNTIRDAFVGLVMQYGAPATGSMAIDRANPAFMPEVDILGLSRSVNAKPDIGAYEAKGFALNVTPTFQAIDPGQSTEYTIHIEPITVNSVTITTGATPSGVDLNLAQTTLSLPGTTTLSLSSMDASMPLMPGKFISLPVTVTGGDFTQSVTINLLIGGSKVYLPIIPR